MATAKRKIQKPRPLWLKLVLALVAVLLLLAVIYRGPVLSQADTATAYGARVACSCRHVDGRDLGQCRDDFEPGMELVMLSEDTEDKSVSAYIPLISSATATYREGAGCQLEAWDD